MPPIAESPRNPVAAAGSPPGRSPPAVSPLVLSLFPGIDLLGRAFEACGYCVVRGPDLIWDQRIEDFHCPPGRFDGVIGGPPCTNYSDANRRRVTAEGDRLVLEFLRVVDEADPSWVVMENVRAVPDILIRSVRAQRVDMTDGDFGGRTGRLRHVQFWSVDGAIIRPARTPERRPVTAVPTLTTAPDGPGDRYCRRCAKMGVAPLSLPALTPAARRRVIGNGVPWGMGVALARAVTARGPVTERDCVCGCGRDVSGARSLAGPACRQRVSRRRRGHFRALEYGRGQSRPG